MAAEITSTSIYDHRKDHEVEGTWEDPHVAFHAFLAGKPKIFGSYGYYCTPHIGAYQPADYTPALPIVLLGVPIVDETAQLPASIALLLAKCREVGIINKPLEAYIVVHSGLERKTCAHLRCDNTDEFNLMYHPWVFRNDNVADTSDEISASLYMGVFEPHGIKTVHLDFVDGGATFNALSPRKVILHDRRFSPDNGNVQLDHSTDTPIFFSLAIDKMLKIGVVTLHVLPVGDTASDAIRDRVKDKETIGDMLKSLEDHVPIAVAHARKMLDPLSSATTGGAGST